MNANAEPGKWLSRSDDAGLIEWLYSGLTITCAPACLINASSPASASGGVRGACANAGLNTSGRVVERIDHRHIELLAQLRRQVQADALTQPRR
ncbi:hypothetical protein [Lysobacter sp. A3-1-A15]|uniref:hypothetical protein n=1 Tax=Novilysobacter viscosus TaxID=3098602 RepID=UPI002ED9E501